MRIELSNGTTIGLEPPGTVEEFAQDWKETLESERILILEVGGKRRFLNPHHIVSIEE